MSSNIIVPALPVRTVTNSELKEGKYTWPINFNFSGVTSTIGGQFINADGKIFGSANFGVPVVGGISGYYPFKIGNANSGVLNISQLKSMRFSFTFDPSTLNPAIYIPSTQRTILLSGPSQDEPPAVTASEQIVNGAINIDCSPDAEVDIILLRVGNAATNINIGGSISFYNYEIPEFMYSSISV